jgi:hypothetical protein
MKMFLPNKGAAPNRAPASRMNVADLCSVSFALHYRRRAAGEVVVMRKGHLRILVALCFTMAACGCNDKVQTVTPKELDGLKLHYQEPKLSTWYYMGTKDGYHYFAHQDLPQEQYYRVAEGALKWQSVAPFTTRRAKWVQLPWGVHDPNFFTNTNFSRTVPKQ